VGTAVAEGLDESSSAADVLKKYRSANSAGLFLLVAADISSRRDMNPIVKIDAWPMAYQGLSKSLSPSASRWHNMRQEVPEEATRYDQSHRP
jgi:hypothetical protein